MNSKGQSINRPSLCRGEKCELWNLKMTTFLEHCNVDLLEVIETRVLSLLDAFEFFFHGILGLR